MDQQKVKGCMFYCEKWTLFTVALLMFVGQPLLTAKPLYPWDNVGITNK